MLSLKVVQKWINEINILKISSSEQNFRSSFTTFATRMHVILVELSFVYGLQCDSFIKGQAILYWFKTDNWFVTLIFKSKDLLSRCTFNKILHSLSSIPILVQNGTNKTVWTISKSWSMLLWLHRPTHWLCNVGLYWYSCWRACDFRILRWIGN